MKAGVYALSLLATPGIVPLLRALEVESMSLAELRRAVGSPPQTTMRAQLRELTAFGVLERSRDRAFPRSVGYELTEAGHDLSGMSRTVDRWLSRGEDETVALGDTPAKRLVKALTDGWEAGIVEVLAAEPRSLTQLSQEISSLSYPSLERRLTAMRVAGLVETVESSSRGAACRPTAWLRSAAAPIAAASRFARAHLTAARSARLEISALLTMAMPAVCLSPTAAGVVTLVTREHSPRSEAEGPAPEGVTVMVRGGRPTSWAQAIEEGVGSWALGEPEAWLDALVDGVLDGLRFGGSDPEFARMVTNALHAAMGEPARELSRPTDISKRATKHTRQLAHAKSR